MKNLTIAAMFIAALAVIMASPTDAKNEAAKGKSKEMMQDRAQEVAERAETERGRIPQRDELARKRDKGAGDDESPDNDDSGDDDSNDDSYDDDSGDDDSYDDDSGDSIDRDKSESGRDNATTRGNEKAQEMRARRDERKSIKEEYKANRQVGDAELGADGNELDTEVDEGSKDDAKKAKKPWWKFWE